MTTRYRYRVVSCIVTDLSHIRYYHLNKETKEGKSEDPKCSKCQKELDNEKHLQSRRKLCLFGYQTKLLQDIAFDLHNNDVTISGSVCFIHAKEKKLILILRTLRISYKMY